MLKIGVNGLPLMAVHTGIARYLKMLYAHMDTSDVSISYVTPGKLEPMPPQGASQGGWMDKVLSLHPYLVYGLRSAQWLAYEHYLGTLSRDGKVDVIHESFYTPSKKRGRAKQVFTLHDLSLVKYPQTHSKDRRMFFDHFFHKRLPEADHVIVPSEYIKDELLDYAEIEESRVSIIHEGVDSRFTPQSATAVSKELTNLGLPKDYFLFVGTLEPRKNLSTLLAAMAQSEHDLPLVIVGWSGWGDDTFQAELIRLGLRDRVFFPGYLTDHQLTCLYSGATAFLYPSLYEGFGLPVLEAMSCGCPVICSNVASIPEVAGDAALLAKPGDVDAWARLMDDLVASEVKQKQLTESGILRSQKFTWDKAAVETLDLFKSLVSDI